MQAPITISVIDRSFGDRIDKINGKGYSSLGGLRKHLTKNVSPGDTVTVQVTRNKQKVDVPVIARQRDPIP